LGVEFLELISKASGSFAAEASRFFLGMSLLIRVNATSVELEKVQVGH
jgi:hypothetical protein